MVPPRRGIWYHHARVYGTADEWQGPSSIAPMKPLILVTGGTGFVGRYVVREMLNYPVDVRIYARSSHGFNAARFERQIEFADGDVTNKDRLRGAMRDCQAVIHLVGIIEENRKENITFESVHTLGTENVVNVALETGVETFVHMSANGARFDGVSRYQSTKWAAEETVRAAGFRSWSIFRPSLIFGRPGPGQPEFCTQLFQTLIRPFPVWPVFGTGEYTFSPVCVTDVARAMASAAIAPPASNRSYCAAGPQTIPYSEMLDILGRATGINPRLKVRQPLWFSRALVAAISRTGLLPISSDQLEMLIEGNCCDPSAFVSEFSIQPTPFTEETLQYLNDV